MQVRVNFFHENNKSPLKVVFGFVVTVLPREPQKVIHSDSAQHQVVGDMEQTNNSIYFLDYNKCIRLPRSQNAFLMYRHTHLPACGIIVAAIKFVMVCQKKASHVAYKTAMVKAN